MVVVVEEAFPLSAGLSVSENHSKMEGPLNGTLQDTQTVEEESLGEDNKELVVGLEVSDDGDGGGKSRSLTETSDVDFALTDEQATQDEENMEQVVQETEDVSESVADSFEPTLNESSPNESSDAIKADQVETTLASDTVELELKKEKGEDFLSPEDTDGVEETELPPSENNNELSSVSGNEGLRETKAVETIKDMTVVKEEEDVLSSVVTDGEEPNPIADVFSKEAVVETSDAKSVENDKVPPKGIEKSLVTSTHEKVGEHLNVQESSSYNSAKMSYQPFPNVPLAESNSATEHDKIEEPSSIENPAIIPVTQRQHTSWTSCCGLFEVLRHGNR